MDKAKQKKVRAFLKRQHAELIAVKQKHIATGLKAVDHRRPALTARIVAWSGDGKFEPQHEKTAKDWAAATAAALAIATRDAISDASADAADLADEHAVQFSALAADVFGADDFDLGSVDYEEDSDHLDDLEESYYGNTRRGALASLLKVAAAVGAGAALGEFADSIGADSSDPSDIADKIFAPVETRTEMYIRTETGAAYGDQLHGVVSNDEALKKRWATIDPGCENICHPTDGQVRDMDDVFDMGDDSTADFPPAHPNCDCVWIPWKDEFGSMRSTDNAADEDMAA